MMSDPQLHHVRMVGIPLDLWHRARTWFDGLIREFDVLATDSGESTPKELVAFVGEVREEFSRFTAVPNDLLAEAHRRGDRTADIDLHVPAEAAPAARHLWDQIQRADDYCRRGDLLTLTLDGELRHYTRWYLMEVADQIEGADPTPWSEVAQPPTR